MEKKGEKEEEPNNTTYFLPFVHDRENRK